MQLPFTETQFLDVFARYNTALWPAAAVLWLLSAGLVTVAILRREAPHRAISALLCLLWAWSAVAYHAAFFTRINPAAWIFAIAFLTQAFLFLRHGVLRPGPRYFTADSARGAGASALVLFGLGYPVVNVMQGLAFPRVPTFGVPCPTALLTAGLLLSAHGTPWKLTAIPLAWSLIGGSAALLLGIHADLMLLVAAALLALSLARRHRPAASRFQARPVS